MEEEKEYCPVLETGEDGNAEPLSLAKGIYRVLDRRNADALKLLSVGGQINLTDYFILCNAKSSTHLRALADEVEYRLGLAGQKPLSREGKGDGDSWIVIDFGCVMVHIFTPEARQFYNLDRLYPDAGKIEVEPEETEKEDK